MSEYEHISQALDSMAGCGPEELISRIQRFMQDMRDFACYQCGNYKHAHQGACNNCKYEVHYDAQ